MSDNEELDTVGDHKGLLNAISNLGKVQNVRKSNRNETNSYQNEFTLVKKKKLASDRKSSQNSQPVKINDIVEVLKKKEKHFETSKFLKNVKKSKHVLEKPLEKTAVERIKRKIGFAAVQKKLMKWDAIVAKNRSDEAQTFPLPPNETIFVNTAAHGKPLKRSIVSDLMNVLISSDNKLKSLQKERSGDIKNGIEEIEQDLKSLPGNLTREEFLARRKELAYLKMRQAQIQSREHMKNKVKSKKYHKLVKREKIKGQIKEFEQLQKNNPEAALERLNVLERNRIYERASLRHRNTGTWAKNLQMRAKYNKNVRQDLAEQLQISRELNRKQQCEKENEDIIDAADLQSDLKIGKDAYSPWTGNSSIDIVKEEDNTKPTNWREYWLERNHNKQLLDNYQNIKSDANSIENEEQAEEDIDVSEVNVKKDKSLKIKQTKSVFENGWLVEAVNEHSTVKKLKSKTIDNIFEMKENKIARRLNSNLKKINNVTKEQNKPISAKKLKLKESISKKNKLQHLNDLSFKNMSTKRPKIDEELNFNDNLQETENITNNLSDTLMKKNIGQEEQNLDAIDTNKITNVRLQKYGHELYNVVADADEEAAVEELNVEDQQMTINQAFGDDDIIADFKTQKSAESEIKNDELSLSMPGWGSWAGAGISQSSKQAEAKRKRLILSKAQETKRSDDSKQNILINNKCSKELRSHLVANLPFPFKSVKDFEASVRAPVSRNFVPETAFRMLTRPNVRTRKGQIIEPMKEDELLKPPKYIRHEVDKRIANCAK